MTAVRTVSVEQRRRAMIRRHHLRGDAAGPEAVVDALVALHATDPATVYLSVLVRCASAGLADVSGAMYERRTLVRWMAMRRTLFVFARSDIPIVQAAVSTPLASTLRSRLISLLDRNGTEPPINQDAGSWLAAIETRVDAALRARSEATGAQLSSDVPELRTAIRPRAASDGPRTVTSMLLTAMSAEGRMVHSTPTGAWTTRGHRWEPADHWWPDGIPALDPDEARRTLAARWLARFGPATVDDLQWWTGWTKTAVRATLADLEIEQVDLHGVDGIALADAANPAGDMADEVEDDAPPAAALLPALDPTPMGWKHRDWLLGIDRGEIFDRAGNIGPTLWWNGEIVGSWAVASSGEVRTALLVDRGADAAQAVRVAAEQLQGRLGGTVVTPAARTPLERALVIDLVT